MALSRWEEVKEKLIQIEAWCRDGLTEEQIAKNLGIGVSTLSKYKVEHIELIEALKRGKEVVDIQVENALFKRALGYKYEEVTRENVYNKETEEYEMIVTKKVVKEVQPDTTAQIFWLKNRKPAEWRDKQEIESHNINENIEYSDEERQKRLAELLEKRQK
jgi:transcriptional regulator with XRE-family HTH domain